jgi:NAD(P)H-quinone oxidoreductase subunit K
VIKLRKKVGNEALAERGKLLPTHRYITIPHQLKAVAPIVDGRYLRAETQQAALAAAAGLPLGTAKTTDNESLETVSGSPAQAEMS